MGEDPGERPPGVLPFRRVKGQGDGGQGDEEGEEAHEGGQGVLGRGEELEVEEGVLPHRLAQGLASRVEGPQGGEEDEDLQDPHPEAGEVVGHLLEEDGP